MLDMLVSLSWPGSKHLSPAAGCGFHGPLLFVAVVSICCKRGQELSSKHQKRINLLEMASTLVVMASNLRTSDGLQPKIP